MSWEKANAFTDELITDLFGTNILGDNHFQKLFARNKEAVDKFIERKTNGMNLSKRVWNYTKQNKMLIEDALSVAIGEGKPANSLASELKKYLNNPDALFRKVKGKDGKMHLLKNP